MSLTSRDTLAMRDLLDQVRMAARLFELVLEEAALLRKMRRIRSDTLSARLRAVREEASLIRSCMPEADGVRV